MPQTRAHFGDLADAAALRAALAEIAAQSPLPTLLALVPEAAAGQVGALQRGARQAGLTLVGAVFPFVLRDGQFVADGAWLVPLPRVHAWALLGQLASDPRPLGERVAEALGPLSDGGAPPKLFCIFDASVPNIATLLAGIHVALADRTTYAGVCAGSETFQPIPCLFDGERFEQDALLCLLLPSDSDGLLMNDYTAAAEPCLATSAAGNAIQHIDWQPAVEVLAARVLREHGVELNTSNFYQYAVQYGFAIVHADGQLLVRMPVALGPEGSVICAGEVPENAILVEVKPPAVGSREMAQRVAAKVRPWQDRPALLFYCAGRRLRLGAASAADLQAVGQECGRQFAGALSLGEIGSERAGEYPHFHNGALLCTSCD